MMHIIIYIYIYIHVYEEIVRKEQKKMNKYCIIISII